MRERKFEKSHIHFLQTETLSRESRVTEPSQDIIESIPFNKESRSMFTKCQHFYSLSWCRGKIYKNWGILLGYGW